MEHISGPKLIVYKMKSKKKYRRKKGHRQQLTKILVSQVSI
jgi:large subunit ribosomal protein L21